MYHTFLLEILNLESLCLSEPQWPPAHLLCACVDHHSRCAFGKAGKQSGPSDGFDLPRAKLGRKTAKGCVGIGLTCPVVHEHMSVYIPTVGTVTWPLVLGPQVVMGRGDAGAGA